MTLSVAERNARADATAAKLTHFTLYQGDPFGAGTEVAGITREAVSWNAASGGSAALSATVTITVPAGASFNHLVGMDTIASPEAPIAKVVVTSSTFADGGTVEVTSATIQG